MVIVSKITEKEVLEIIETLEIRVDELIQKCTQLNIDNQSLKENNQKLSETQYIAGDEFSFADNTGICAIDFAISRRLAIPEKCRNVHRWHSEVSARPSVLD